LFFRAGVLLFSKVLITLMLLIIAWTGACEAGPTDLVSLDLSLAGYQLGMSYENVAEVRPFSYEQSFIKSPGHTPTFYALAEGAYVDGATMNIQVSFRNEKVHKIVARVSADFFENVLRSIQKTMGTGEDKSRVFRNYKDEDIQQTIFQWAFPKAEMSLIEVSSNTEFATISLASK
jgi:hypothetical protein